MLIRRSTDKGDSPMPSTSATPSTTTGCTRTWATTGWTSPNRCGACLTVADTEGIAVDLEWNGLFDAVQEQTHKMRAGTRVTLDAQRSPRPAPGRGSITSDGEEIAADPALWIAADRSLRCAPQRRTWNPPGGPLIRRSRACGGNYYHSPFDDTDRRADHPGGTRRLPHSQRLQFRVWKDGRIEQLGWRGSPSTMPRAQGFHRRDSRDHPPRTAASSPSRSPRCWAHRSTSAVVTAVTRTGPHGKWLGENFTRRVDYT